MNLLHAPLLVSTPHNRQQSRTPTTGKHIRQPLYSVGDNQTPADISPSKRMRPHNRPLNIGIHVCEKSREVSMIQMVEDVENLAFVGVFAVRWGGGAVGRGGWKGGG